ncbi:MAG: hypothetical protein MZV49_15920 [Rhodopseudomonas palustris]|nr:hypothetical protein [Rhodopseudomonas palustris]
MIVRVIKDYCQQRGIKVEQRLDGWLVVLHGDGFKHFVYGYDIGLNSAVVHRIANDKSATAELLSAEGVASRAAHAVHESKAVQIHADRRQLGADAGAARPAPERRGAETQ